MKIGGDGESYLNCRLTVREAPGASSRDSKRMKSLVKTASWASQPETWSAETDSGKRMPMRALAPFSEEMVKEVEPCQVILKAGLVLDSFTMARQVGSP